MKERIPQISYNICTSPNIYCFILTSGWWPPSLISCSAWHRTAFTPLFLCCMTRKTCVKPSKFCCYNTYMLWHTLFTIHFRFMATIFDSPLTLTSDSIRTSPVVLPYPENMDIAVGISFLSCIQAEICVMWFLLPVTDRYLWFLTNTHVGQSPQ